MREILRLDFFFNCPDTSTQSLSQQQLLHPFPRVIYVHSRPAPWLPQSMVLLLAVVVFVLHEEVLVEAVPRKRNRRSPQAG